MSEDSGKAYDKKFGKLYLKRAKGNLYSSKILLKEKQYVDSVFLLQQSVEKTLKGYALYTGVLVSKDFEQRKKSSSIGRGHGLFDIFKRMFEKRKLRLEKIKGNCLNEPEIYTIMNINPEKIAQQQFELEIDLEKLREIEESSKEYRMSEEELQKYLSDIEKINQGIEEIFKKFATIENTIPGKLVKIYVKKERKIQIIFNGFQLLFLSIKVGGALLNLSIIVKAHVNKSRYPDVDLDFDPDEFYTDSLPLISHLEKIQDATEKCIRDIESFVSITESTD